MQQIICKWLRITGRCSVKFPVWAGQRHLGWDQPAFDRGCTGPCARDLKHTSSWARSSEVGSAPGSPTYIAHVDGSLVNLLLLLGCLWEESCRDKGSCWTESQEPFGRGTSVHAGLLPAATELPHCKAPWVPGHVQGHTQIPTLLPPPPPSPLSPLSSHKFSVKHQQLNSIT